MRRNRIPRAWIPWGLGVVILTACVAWKWTHPPKAPAPALRPPSDPYLPAYRDDADTRRAWGDGYFVGAKAMHDAYHGPPDAPEMPHAGD